MSTSYGIGMNQDRQYVVYINGVIVATYPALRSALAHVDAHRADPYVRWDEGRLANETLDRFHQEKRAGGAA
jgi:hypothetical protein